MTITIGLDGHNLALSAGTGIATYARTLHGTIVRFGWETFGLFDIDVGTDPELSEILFFERLMATAKRKAPALHKLKTRFGVLPPLVEVELGSVDLGPIGERIPAFDRIVSGRDLFRAAYQHFRRTGALAAVRLKRPPDIMHWTYPMPVRIEGVPNVYTVHDLVPLRMPYMTLDDKRVHHALVRACALAAERICTVSRISAEELVQLCPEAAPKIVTTYQTCDISGGGTDAPEEEEVVVRSLGLRPGCYFLYYGALEPKKNVGRLIEAHVRSGTETPLVIVTGRSWNSEGERALIDGMRGHTDKLIVLEYMPRGILQALVRNAKAVTFPSLHEGFGLPVLEAMQLGVPVLTGNTGGVVEVAGDAGLLVDPYDVADIRRGISRLDQDGAYRKTLIEKGFVQARKFSADRYGGVMHHLYESILAHG